MMTDIAFIVGPATLVAACGLLGWYIADSRQRRWRAPLGILMISAAVTCMVATGPRQSQADEAHAFGRGAIAVQCKVLSDQHPDPDARPAEVTASLSHCQPYLDELHHRTGGQS